MAKKPAQHGLVKRAVAMIKRNPWKFVAGAVAVLGGIPSAAAGVLYLNNVAEPWYVAQRYWVRDHSQEVINPYVKVQAEHEQNLNYLLLRDARQALKDAKDDLAKNPNSTEAKAAVDHYQRSIDSRLKKLETK